MPEMNGWQFRAEQLRDSALRNIPVVVMTASRGVDPEGLGGAEVLQKPVGLGDILEAVARNALHA
jgi:CheY-like chemotaxis protein